MKTPTKNPEQGVPAVQSRDEADRRGPIARTNGPAGRWVLILRQLNDVHRHSAPGNLGEASASSGAHWIVHWPGILFVVDLVCQGAALHDAMPETPPRTAHNARHAVPMSA